MINIQLENKELELVKEALDLYTRLGLGQFESLLSHPQMKSLMRNKETDYHRQGFREELENHLLKVRNELFNLKGNFNASFALGNDLVVKKVRDADTLWHKLHTKSNEETKFSDIKFGSIFVMDDDNDKTIYLKISSVECISIYEGPGNKIEINPEQKVRLLNEW